LEQGKQKLETILKTKEQNKRRNLRVILPIVSVPGLISGAFFFVSHRNQQLILRGSTHNDTKENTTLINAVKNNIPPLVIDEKKDTTNDEIISADSNSGIDSSHDLIAAPLLNKDSFGSKEKPLAIVSAKKNGYHNCYK